jgi:Tfp pilus assembly protein PilX
MTISTMKDERGFAMVTAIVLMALMLGLGLAALQMTESNSSRTREQRVRESALQLGEGVLYAQSLVLTTKWANEEQPYPAQCTSGGAASDTCPSAATLAGSADANFANVDQLNNSSWITKVRDNGGALRSSYDPLQADLAQTTTGKGTCPLTPCTFDFNEDNEVWVQAQSTVRGKPRNVVARLRLEEIVENVPQAGVTAGALSVTNSGSHGGTPIIDATGSTVLVRCPSTDTETCVNAKNGQVVPAPESQTSAPNLMTPQQLERFRQRAITDGRYYPGCPTRDPVTNKYDFSGKVVFIEGCLSPPNLTNQVQTVTCNPPSGMSNKCTNLDDEPGLVIWHCGRADMAGGYTHRGILYVANNSDGTCPAGLGARGDGQCVGNSVDETRDVLTTNGGFAVWGALAVDGAGCMKIGSNGLQVRFDPNVFDAAQSYGTVGLVQNTWRELRPQDA